MTTRRGLGCTVELDFGHTDWYGSITAQLSQHVRALPMWSRFTVLRPDDGTPGPLTPERFAAISGDVGNRSWYLDSGGQQDVAFRCFRDGAWLDLTLELREDDVGRYGNDLEGILTGFAGAFQGAIVRQTSGIEIQFNPDLPYAPLPDHPESAGVRFGHVADALDRRIQIAQAENRAAGVIHRLLAAPLPPGVRQVEIGDVVCYFWTDDFTDPEKLARARQAHERWMVSCLST